MLSPLIDQLIASLRTLPGVGPKSAQRMALHLLERNRPAALQLAANLKAACEQVKRCDCCRILTEQTRCHLCSSPKRQTDLLCVVENPADVMALEQSGIFRGRYFVLYGKLSPIDGIGPAELGLDSLFARLQADAISELIIATNPTMEGEATAHFIAQKAKPLGVKVTRIAHGVPIGGELEYIDGGTLAHALTSRREL
ncbi:MAG: recombination protein RecR [Pseudomonadota bacterium]